MTTEYTMRILKIRTEPHKGWEYPQGWNGYETREAAERGRKKADKLWMDAEVYEYEEPDTLIATISQVGGGVREIHAQDKRYARRARELLRLDPAIVERLDGVDGIRITVRDR